MELLLNIINTSYEILTLFDKSPDKKIAYVFR